MSKQTHLPVHGNSTMLIRYITKVMVFLIIIAASSLLLKGDSKAFLKWWLILLLLGVIFLPLTQALFSKFHDNGYLFSKTIGLALSGYLMWLLSSLRLLKFTSVSCYIVVALFLCFNIFLLMKKNRDERLSLFSRDKIDSMLNKELLFLILFLIWTYIRGFKPEAYGTEKFMDYGFMRTMMRADYMPPKDLWFAGSTINYYYVGQYMAAFLTKLSLNTVNTGYNLILMTLAAFAFVLPYSLIFNVTKNFIGEGNKKLKNIPKIAGILSGAGVSLAGNLHFTLFYWVIPVLQDLLGIEHKDKAFWFPDSTRYIGYNPDTKDKTIHEFPNYSFVLGDVHAHVVNIIFVITVLGILFAWLQHQNRSDGKSKLNQAVNIKILKKEVLNPYILIIGFFIGLFHTTNFWDFPIYFVVAGGVILASNIIRFGIGAKTLCVTALQGIIVILTEEITALPFTIKFDQISTDILAATSHTPLYQLFILWGLPVILVIGFVGELITSYRQKQNVKMDGTSVIKSEKIVKNDMAEEDSLSEACEITGIIPSDTESKNIFQGFLQNLHPSELYILILGLCAIGLVIIPEIIYVKDIYSGDYKRANTMFKLTYQAFIMFGICSGFIFFKFMKQPKFRWQKKFAAITFILFLSSLWYSKVAVSSWYGNIFKISDYKGLDASAFLKSEMPDDYLATKWLNENIKGTPVVLEANGDSYSDYERVSVTTGLPTVLGWYVHEWLWRGDTKLLEERAADIQNIYTSADSSLVDSLIEKYKIEYIYVGKLELDKFENINHSLLKNLGDTVFMSPADSDKPYETYIIRIHPKG